MANDNSVKGRANDMGNYLRNSKNATQISQEQALEYANQGVVIFASYVSDGSEPGHVAVVAPTENLTYSSSRNENVVSVFNVGAKNGEMTLTQAFGTREVGLFILNTDLNNVKAQTPLYKGAELQEVIITGQNGTITPSVPLLTVKPIETPKSLPNQNNND